MTVSSLTTKNSYSGNGSTTTFAYGFKIFTSAEIKVFIRSAAGTETLKSLTTHYTLTNVGNASGGNVVFESDSVPAATETVVLIRDTALTQTLDLVENDPFLSGSFENSLDKVTHQMIELQEEVDRSFKVSQTTSITSDQITDSAATRASKTLGFDSDGNLTTVSDFLPKGGDSAQFTYSTTTTDSDPGSGIVRFNNSSIGSATIAYIDDLDAAGTDVSAWVQSFDDVSGNDTNRGRIRVSKSNTLDTWHVFKVSAAVVDASGYTKVNLTYIDGAGTLANEDKIFISFVASGEDGSIPGYFYKFDAGTSKADPGAGELSFNNGTYANVTKICIDDADSHGVTTQADTETWGSSTSTIKGFLHIVDINDETTYARFKVTAAASDESGFNELTVVHLASNNTFSAADELSVHFSQSGNTGDAATIEVGTVGATTVSAGGSATASVANAGNTGAATFNFSFGVPTGATGATGALGANSGLSMTWSNSTTDADPGNGKLAMNNATLGSVSILYIDDLDDAGATISGFVQSWDDAVNTTARGIITLTKEATPATFWIGKVSSAVVNASGYTKVNVTHIVSNGSFSNTDGINVGFAYSGADGADGSDGDDGADGDGTFNNFVLTADSGTNQTVTTTNTVDIAGGSSINTVVGATDTVTINADDATTSAKGVASFSSDNFAVSSGAVTIKDAGVDLTAEVTGTLPVNKGGSGAATHTANNVLIGAGTSAITSVAPSTSGNVLTSNGTVWASAAASSGGIEWQSSIVTASTITVVAGRGYWINTTSNACTITLPSSASVGDEIILSDYAKNWGTNAITINANSLNYQGDNTYTNSNGDWVQLIYSGATKGWIPAHGTDFSATGGTITTSGGFKIHTFTSSGTFTPSRASTVEYLVIAGGAGGGYNGGGGGAGGFRTATGFSVAATGLTVTVGAGGAGAGSTAADGVNGSNSVFSTITSTGGGGGGSNSRALATAGGSSGGNGRDSGTSFPSVASSPAGQGHAGGSNASGSPYPSGGGGGAGAVGVNGSGNQSGAGGAGLASSFSGASVVYAGGGGGGGDTNAGNAAGAGGSGGGGAGAGSGGTPGVGTVNTGSGGGGGANSGGSAGGSGIVIIRYAVG